MEFDNLLTLIKTVSASSLDEFFMKDQGMEIRMKKEQLEGERNRIGGCSGERRKEAPHKNADQSLHDKEVWNDQEVLEREMIAEGKTTADGNLVVAPLVGTFYAAPSPDAESFVKIGDPVKKGQILGIIEAMKLMNEIESEYDGVVKEILIKNGEVAEYGQPLFVIG